MTFLRRLASGTVATQVTALAVLSVLLANALPFLIISVFLNGQPEPTDPRAWEAVLGTVARMASGATSPEGTAIVVAAAQRAGVPVRELPVADLVAAATDAGQVPEIVYLRLADRWGLTLLRDVGPTATHAANIVVSTGRESALVFDVDPATFARPPVLSPLVPILSALAIILIILVAYSVRVVASPLSSFAAAARSFASFPVDDLALPENGPKEIREASQAFNAMRAQIRRLVRERTEMLLALSHDVRTPLTRLRLRVEKAADSPAAPGMLGDIAAIDHMVDEALAYLRDGHFSERLTLMDLPSLLQSICSAFSDIGHEVRYEGPDRFSYPCKPLALSRAISNLVDNAVKSGSQVSVGLDVQHGVTVRVADDGPGLPPEQREAVFVPFAKASPARESHGRSGFGLGLAIARDVVRDHAGRIWLEPRLPHGLVAVVALPGADGAPNVAIHA